MEGMATRVHETDVCIVGGGPSGMVLGLLLARAGVRVEVVERRESPLEERGADLLGAPTLEALEQLLGADGMRALPPTAVSTVDLVVDGIRLHLDGPHPADAEGPVAVPRRDLLGALTRAAGAVPTLSLRSGTVATGLRRAGEAITGVTARDHRGDLEIRARLTVGADGRGSLVRAAAGLVLTPIAGPVDVVWVRVPARQHVFTPAHVGEHRIVVGAVDDGSARLGLLLDTGGAARLRAAGLEAAVAAIRAAVPSASATLGSIGSWSELTAETIDVSRLEEWHRPGLLVIGEAAHPMSPLGGVGTDLAVQDAVVAANRLAGPLLDGRPLARELAAVGRRRTAAAEAVQSLQLTFHAALAGLASRQSLHRPPTRLERAALRTVLPVLRSLVPRLMRRGVRAERILARDAGTARGVMLR
ncbi:FAD-dependent oxidoreductase [Humibacter sp. BT305]|nr:FAD-dependent oxidoreductase [Humibacter sp. BT305]